MIAALLLGGQHRKKIGSERTRVILDPWGGRQPFRPNPIKSSTAPPLRPLLIGTEMFFHARSNVFFGKLTEMLRMLSQLNLLVTFYEVVKLRQSTCISKIFSNL